VPLTFELGWQRPDAPGQAIPGHREKGDNFQVDRAGASIG
jgi:hypothetical protein